MAPDQLNLFAYIKINRIAIGIRARLRKYKYTVPFLRHHKHMQSSQAMHLQTGFLRYFANRSVPHRGVGPLLQAFFTESLSDRAGLLPSLENPEEIE